MAFDLSRDVRRIRLALLGTALLLLGLLGAVAARGLWPEWRKWQHQFAQPAPEDPHRTPGIIETRSCAGTLERCQTCHLGERTATPANQPEMPQPLGPHPDIGPHDVTELGCTICHGGTPRALTTALAHQLPGTTQPDPFLSGPSQQAACSHCHIPGAVSGTERLVRGANLFLAMGCAICHSLHPAGRGGWDFGPDLHATGRQTVEQLRTSLLEPTANFAGSTMPSYRPTFAEQPDALIDLLVFLQALALPRAPACAVSSRSSGWVDEPCGTCHARTDTPPQPQFRHRCRYLLERKAELACRSCHPQTVPDPGPGGGYCPLVREHRGACDTCHLRSNP